MRTSADVGSGAAETAAFPGVKWHLTARPWQPSGIEPSAYLETVERVCRFTAGMQDACGAIIDPILGREHRYSTAYFAFAAATLVSRGRAEDLLQPAMQAMEHATACVAGGADAIPDRLGEFFLAPLAGALSLLAPRAGEARASVWRQRLCVPLLSIIDGEHLQLDHRRTCAMRGEWLRSTAGLAHRDRARDFIERHWLEDQRERIVNDCLNLYQDHSTDPESHAVEAVGRVNLLALVEAGFDGKSGAEMRRAVERGTAASLLLQDPSGQCPPNGRTCDHVVNDALHQLGFEMMAEREHARGNAWSAGQYRRAAMLSFRSIARWQRDESPWAGSFYASNHRFDPGHRAGMEPIGNYGNCYGAVMCHLAESYLVRRHEFPETPSPTEIGGYAAVADPRFASVFVNAGGMQMVINLRGDVAATSGADWMALGAVRFSRPEWDSRLGPSDGARDRASGGGASFGPTWMEGGRWVRLADIPGRYQGRFEASFVHPLLVRCAVEYAPLPGKQGPTFRHHFVITPDGILATLESAARIQYAVTFPMLEHDGGPLRSRVGGYIASVRYPDGTDEQNFISLASNPGIAADEDPLRSSYGWLRPVRSRSNITFIYPRVTGDPPAEAVRVSFRQTAQGFSSVLGRVNGSLYVGRTSAGGKGKSIDIDGDGRPEATFTSICGFILQIENGVIRSVEADRAVGATIGNRRLSLEPYHPELL
ncbi:MAG TPA: hypothetical protein VN442_24840 [Bryobacteraceae bacterium]|nr:hypothetical protein [Bryobacteraceae bacterium]